MGGPNHDRGQTAPTATHREVFIAGREPTAISHVVDVTSGGFKYAVADLVVASAWMRSSGPVQAGLRVAWDDNPAVAENTAQVRFGDRGAGAIAILACNTSRAVDQPRQLAASHPSTP